MADRDVVIPDGQQHLHDEWHLAPAVRAGGLLYCSGVIGVLPDGTVPQTPADQYHTVFRNLGVLLGAAGVGFQNIVEILSFHLDLPAQIETFGQVKDSYIEKPYPAWTAVEVAGLGAGAYPGLLVEVKVTAAL